MVKMRVRNEKGGAGEKEEKSRGVRGGGGPGGVEAWPLSLW